MNFKNKEFCDNCNKKMGRKVHIKTPLREYDKINIITKNAFFQCGFQYCSEECADNHDVKQKDSEVKKDE